jgi:adenine-specific DNA-methyltransferase
VSNVESLIGEIENAALRDRLSVAVAELKARLDWGLVFERHLPERARLLVAPIRVGSVVWERRSAKPRRLRVRAIENGELTVVAEPEKTTASADAPTERIPRADVLIEHDLAQPVFPLMTPIGEVRNGPAERPCHAVIQGENYDTLEALLATYPKSFDVMYLDPPYNTGNKDWAYDNDYVDPADTYRSSKWLAFMERRLKLARRLLKDDGVMLVTIDENEIHHLGMLLEQLFPDARRQMVTIAINPGGAAGEGFSRVDEQAFFVFFGEAEPSLTSDDFFGEENKSQAAYWERLMRRGSSWVRSARSNLCYPLLVDSDGHIAGAGEPFTGDDESQRPTRQGDYELAWPVRTDGKLGIWRIDADRLRRFYPLGYAVTVKRSRETWSARYLLDGAIQAIERGEVEVVGKGPFGDALLSAKGRSRVLPKTMWHRSRHNAGGEGGTQLVAALVGRGAFSYPKSVYAVRDVLEATVGDKPDALVLDFFAGSGTTLHATMLLNSQDGGRRRCVLATNNEVNAESAAKLNRADHFRGDPEFEAKGVFESATRPRVTAAVTGLRAGEPIEGEYLDGRAYADGFSENVEFYRLDYCDGAEIEFGLRFSELHPMLWLRAGGIGERESLDPTKPLGLPKTSPYAVLFDPSGMRELLAALPNRTDLTHAFIVADSADTFAQLASQLPDHLEKIRLYRDYLESVRSATR